MIPEFFEKFKLKLKLKLNFSYPSKVIVDES